MRTAGLIVALLAGFARAQEPSAAELCPADTFLFLEADAGALLRGVPQLDLVRLVQDPSMRAFLAPTLQRLGATGEKPVEELLARLGVGDWLQGRAAVALRGFTVTTRGADGAPVTTLVSPDAPLGGDLVLRLLGAMVARETGLGARDARGPAVTVRPDLLLVAEPGPKGKALADAILANARQETFEVAGRQAVRYAFGTISAEGVALPLEAFGVTDGERWVFATERATLEAALAADRGKSLATTPGFARARDRVTCGERVVFLHVDVAAGLRMFRTLVSPLAQELLEKAGVTSLRGFSFGLSFVEGGVRESFGLHFDGEPRGALRLLEALPGGFPALASAPHDAVAFLGVRFDAQLLVERARQLLAALLPGVDRQLDAMLDAASQEAGIDLRGTILPAFGDEVAVVVHRAMGLMPPEWVASVGVRDAAKFRTLVESGLAATEMAGARVNREVAGGGADFALAFPRMPMFHAVFALREGRFLGASTTRTLGDFLAKPAEPGFKSLAKDGAVFGRTMRGLTGGGTDRLVALAYVDLRQLAPIGVMALQFAGPEGIVDKSQAPDARAIAELVGGLAVGVQRDGDALTLDAFSPAGFVLPSAAAGVAYERQRERRLREQLEAWRKRREEGAGR